MNRGYKTQLAPNNRQATLFRQHCGASRFAYNWGLERRIQEYEESGKSSNAIEQHRQLNKLKKAEFPWLYEVSKCPPQEALRDLDRAFKNFFRRVKQKQKTGFPKFKSKKHGLGSFRLTGAIKIEDKRVKLPRIGWVRLKEHGYLPICSPSQITISEKAGRWFVSFNLDLPDRPKIKRGETIGIDLGINHLAICSDGTSIENQRHLDSSLRNLARAQRSLSRKRKGSNNRRKAKERVQRIHLRTANQRRDHLHKATTSIAKTKPKTVVMENLNVQGMMSNHCLAKGIGDASFYEFRRQMEYKTVWNGGEMIFADQFFPSSKRCSSCGHLKTNLTLADREFKCDECGMEIDRDMNAALNLRRYPELSFNRASSVQFEACGDDVRPMAANAAGGGCQ